MRVALAVGVSVAVHAGVVLWAKEAPVEAPAAPELGTEVEVFDTPLPASRPAPAPAPTAASRARRRRDTTPVAVTAATAADLDAPALRPEVDLAPATLAGTAPEPEQVPEAQPGGPAAPPPGPSFDVSFLHAALVSSARRCYPRAARRYRLTGTATVDFCLDATGALGATKLLRSSGAPLLDDAAVGCVIEGALPLPEAAFGRCYQVPVRFGDN